MYPKYQAHLVCISCEKIIFHNDIFIYVRVAKLKSSSAEFIFFLKVHSARNTNKEIAGFQSLILCILESTYVINKVLILEGSDTPITTNLGVSSLLQCFPCTDLFAQRGYRQMISLQNILTELNELQIVGVRVCAF